MYRGGYAGFLERGLYLLAIGHTNGVLRPGAGVVGLDIGCRYVATESTERH